MNKPDHFSRQAQAYSRYRPCYPAALFQYLGNLCVVRELAWDCGTGNGQAATSLADYFDRVIATDISAAQIGNAVPVAKVEYRVGSAEHSGIESQCMDLILVAQALHWFEIDVFYREAKRILKPGGVLAVVSYQLPRINPAINTIVDDFYAKTLGPYWPSERRHIDNAYRDIPFPLRQITSPLLQIEHDWTLDQFLGYLQSWSAIAYFRKHQNQDPVALIKPGLTTAWSGTCEHVTWPLIIRVGKFDY